MMRRHNRRPLIADLFCGAGGAAMGLWRAGFEPVGFDIMKQPRYPFQFVQQDALTVDLSGFDAVWASPPYIRSGMVAKDGRHPELLPATRRVLEKAGKPWVIENVPGAPLRKDVVLCGSMFGLGLRRHRVFEMSPASPILRMRCDHARPVTGVYGHPHGQGGAWRNGNKPMLPSTMPVWKEQMGIDWMTAAELAQAVPPAYSEFLGRQLLAALP